MMSAPLIAPVRAPAGESFERLAANPTVGNEVKVAEAARQFEALLLRHILTEARKPVLTRGDDPPTVTDSIYADLINATLADHISRSGLFGLAEPLHHQLARQTTGTDPHAAAGPTPAPDLHD